MKGDSNAACFLFCSAREPNFSSIEAALEEHHMTQHSAACLLLLRDLGDLLL